MNNAFKKDFPLLHQKVRDKALVYLDNSATTQKPQVVLDTLQDYYKKNNANPHRGVYDLSERATKLYEQAREKVKSFINAKHAIMQSGKYFPQLYEEKDRFLHQQRKLSDNILLPVALEIKEEKTKTTKRCIEYLDVFTATYNLSTLKLFFDSFKKSIENGLLYLPCDFPEIVPLTLVLHNRGHSISIAYNWKKKVFILINSNEGLEKEEIAEEVLKAFCLNTYTHYGNNTHVNLGFSFHKKEFFLMDVSRVKTEQRRKAEKISLALLKSSKVKSLSDINIHIACEINVNTQTKHYVMPIIRAWKNSVAFSQCYATPKDRINCEDYFSGQSLLRFVCIAGDANKLKELIGLGVDINEVPIGGDGETVLMYAARTGNAEAVEILLKYKADPNYHKNGLTALYLAVLHGDLATTMAFLNGGASLAIPNNNNTSFFGDIHILRCNDERDFWRYTNQSPSYNFFKNGAFLLYLALHKGFDDIAAALIKAGSNIDDALILVSIYGKANDAKKLLERKADVNYKIEWGETGKYTTPLLLAMKWQPNANDLIKTLILAGADIEQLDLTQLFNLDSTELLKFLLVTKKLNPNKVNNTNGNTLLHEAMKLKNSKEVVELLLQAGANPNVTNQEGLMPLDFIVQNPESYGENAKTILQLMIRHGATIDFLKYEDIKQSTLYRIAKPALKKIYEELHQEFYKPTQRVNAGAFFKPEVREHKVARTCFR